MNDTVKLIIEISRIEYEQTCNLTLHNRTFYDEAIRNGTPLDSNSERAEVQAYFDGEAYGWEQGRKALIDDVKAEIRAKHFHIVEKNDFDNGRTYAYEECISILDNIGKAESEVKPNE
jgi:hypothetical protein